MVAWALLATAIVSIPIITHGNVGITQFGYRFSLDFQLLLFVILATVVARGWTRLMAAAAVASIIICAYAVWAISIDFGVGGDRRPRPAKASRATPGQRTRRTASGRWASVWCPVRVHAAHAGGRGLLGHGRVPRGRTGLGLTHPTGYPTYLPLGWLWTHYAMTRTRKHDEPARRGHGGGRSRDGDLWARIVREWLPQRAAALAGGLSSRSGGRRPEQTRIRCTC